MRGAGRVVFAAILLLVAGTLNVIYGFGALDDASFFVNDTRFILDDLNTLGWVLIILGVIQLIGGFSLMAGNTFGRVIGIAGVGQHLPDQQDALAAEAGHDDVILHGATSRPAPWAGGPGLRRRAA